MNITRYTGATAEIDLNDDVNKHCGIGNGQHRVRLAQALVGALFGVDHPLAVEISHVSVGFATHVHFYIPKGTTGDELDSFRKAMQEAVDACCVKHCSADSMPNTPPRT